MSATKAVMGREDSQNADEDSVTITKFGEEAKENFSWTRRLENSDSAQKKRVLL